MWKKSEDMEKNSIAFWVHARLDCLCLNYQTHLPMFESKIRLSMVSGVLNKVKSDLDNGHRSVF